MTKLAWSYQLISLKLKHPFAIAKFTRTSTPVLLLRLNYDGFFGFGEASMVPYLGETFETAIAFLGKVDWQQLVFPFDFGQIVAYLDGLATGNTAVKAAIDIALHDLNGKILNRPCYQIYGANPTLMPVTSFTIGIDTPEMVKKKVLEADNFKAIKIKLGSHNDREIVEAIRTITNKPLYIDANQGWADKIKAIDLIYWLHDKGAVFVEQPMDKHDLDGNAWLTERSPIPILADESLQRLADLDKVKGAYHGINVKLMKCGGMYEAYRLILRAKQLGMKVLMGCMSETSCASQAGAALAPLCHWCDLDGPWLTTNNPFETPPIKEGKYLLGNLPGLGLAGNAIF